ncbi:MAG TPA: proline racemase family protein [Candidatus Binatia bacterium]|nr:proline racemase family protein [Candidatus Binatia bacterium]
MRRIEVIDSHTAGEPTRVVISGGPDLGSGPISERLKRFREEHDRFRSAIVNEPRGSDVIVGALLLEHGSRARSPSQSDLMGVIFFNNVGYLNMCGHGTIGVVATLAHLKRIPAGEHRLETPVGNVDVTLHKDGSVSVMNVPSYRKAKGVTIKVEGLGKITGDVAWGGNWFFLVEEHPFKLDFANVEQLTEATWGIRQAINAQGFPEVDHIELFSGRRNFVLCPGKAYDRSPCGTGTSAKLACLAADGKLAEGETWTQESIIGSRFTGTYKREGDKIRPIITGSAFITGEATLLLDENDPFCWGIGK